MMRICLPCRSIAFVGLVAPHRPVFPRATGKHFEERARAASFDDFILLVGFARMLAFARGEQIDLTTAGCKRARILPAHSKEDEFGHIAKIEPNPASIRTTILTNLVPDDVRLVVKAPGLHYRQAFRQKGVWTPQVKMRLLRGDVLDGKRLDIVERERAIPREAPVLRRHLSSLVGELPRRVCEDGRKLALAGESEEIEAHAIDRVRKHAEKLHRFLEQSKNIHSIPVSFAGNRGAQRGGEGSLQGDWRSPPGDAVDRLSEPKERESKA